MLWRHRAHTRRGRRQSKRQSHWTALVLAILTLLVGFVSADHTSVPVSAAARGGIAGMASVWEAPLPSAGCGSPSPITPGTSTDVTITADPAISNSQHTRLYRLHVPAAYQGTAPHAPMPVVLVFHGSGGTAAGMEASSGFTPLAEHQHFLAVYPQGLTMPDGSTFWASAGPVDEGIDEITFVGNVLDDLERRLCVDEHRIYATGFSNGGGMVGYLACRLADRIAAFAPASGNYYAVPGGCHPAHPVPLMAFHGTADPIVPYDGIPSREAPDWRLPSIPEWLAGWAARDGCSGGPQVFLQQPGITGEQWTGCQGTSTLIHYREEGGGHTLIATINGLPATLVIWRFFQAHAS